MTTAGPVLGSIALLVTDYDEAIAYYTQVLGFELLEDTALSADKRWVKVIPPGGGCALLLAKAADPQQTAMVGNQCGGRVMLFLETPDFWATYHAMEAQGANFCEVPRLEPYGHVCVFTDLYGNRWDLLERR